MNGLRHWLYISVMIFVALTFAPRFTSVGDVSLSVVLTIVWLFASAANALSWGSTGLPVASRDSRLYAIFLFCCFALSVFSLASALYAEDPFRTMRTSYFQMLGAITTLVIASSCRDWRRLEKIISVVAIAGLVSAAFSIMSLHVPGMEGLIFRETGRTSGLFKHPNQLGMALSSVAPLVVGWSFARWGVGASLTCAAILFVGSVYSGSKTNLVLTMIAVAPVFLVMTRAIANRYLRTLSIFGTIGLIAIAAPIAAEFVAMISPRAYRILYGLTIGDTSEAGSLMTRLTLWNESIDLGLSNPLLGVGAGQPIGAWPHSHNVFMDYFRTLGVPGLLMVAIQIAAACSFSVKASMLAISGNQLTVALRVYLFASASSVVIFIISNQSSESFGPNTVPLLWIYLGILLALLRVTRDRVQSARKVAAAQDTA